MKDLRSLGQSKKKFQLKRKPESLATVTYELIDSKSSSRQPNFNDCGIYAIINVRLIMKGTAINSSTYTEEYAKLCRLLFKYELT